MCFFTTKKTENAIYEDIKHKIDLFFIFERKMHVGQENKRAISSIASLKSFLTFSFVRKGY